MKEILQYLYGLQARGIKLGLETMKYVADLLGNPQEKFKSVHITGTNGKGSTAAYIASILKEAGFKVGLYTSPHLVRFNERIQINGKEIEDGEIARLTAKIKEKVEMEHLEPTFFEFTTVMAFLYFAEQEIDIAVIEVGLGGRLDATNIITPLVSIITNIGFDHQQMLGTTKEEIAKEKAGIIKPGVPVVTGEKDATLINLFEHYCQQSCSRFLIVEHCLKVKRIYQQEDRQEMDVTGLVKGKFKLSLVGRHQIDNVCTALVAIDVLQKKGMNISSQAVKKGLERAAWPGRLQKIEERPLIYLDGAHNLEGMTCARVFMEQIPRRKTLVIGIAKDKDILAMMATIAPLFSQIIVTQGNFKPAKIGLLAKEARKYSKEVYEIAAPKEALHKALEITALDECIFITGSLYLIGDMLALLKTASRVKTISLKLFRQNSFTRSGKKRLSSRTIRKNKLTCR